jgi:hypothetical protein
MKKSKQSTK